MAGGATHSRGIQILHNEKVAALLAAAVNGGKERVEGGATAKQQQATYNQASVVIKF